MAEHEKNGDSRILFGRAAVAMGLVTPQQVADCLDLQRRLAQGGRPIPLGKIMLAKGNMTAFQIQEVLDAQSRHAVRCAACGAEFAVRKGPADGAGPVRCPQCLRRLSDAIPVGAPPGREGDGDRIGMTQQLETAPAPPGPGQALHVEPVKGEPTDVDVPTGGRVELGRAPGEGGVTIADLALSRRHCAVTNEGGRLLVEDLGSRNGTYVNGARVVRQPLRPGDEIEIGESRILVRAPRAGDGPTSNTTDLWRAEGLCMLCGMVVASEELAEGLAQRAEHGIICPKCLKVALVPGRTLGGYRIIEQIGRGGMAEVYRAEQATGHLIVALKTLTNPQKASESARSRFVQEARAGARLEHPNLVRIFDAGEESGIPYIVLEYIEGEDLADILDARGLLDVPTIALDIAAALAYAHSHGVIHRDVKPGNIILDRTYRRARLLDLGVAKIHDLDEGSRLTRPGVGLGTLEYASPEQIQSAKDVDGRADVYSLGATLYRMVMGQRPFDATRELDIAKAILAEPVRWPEDARGDAPKPLRAVIERAMQKKPKSRYDGANEFRAALAKVREEMG
ncbi:MAG: protein kinase domain-containing protein [Planctomycetota bacterium]|jgi:serine/threonine-protein kinase